MLDLQMLLCCGNNNNELIAAGVTRIERGKLALVLAGLADGTAPSRIARKVGVGYAMVARIADTTKRLQRAGTGAGRAVVSTNGSGRVTP